MSLHFGNLSSRVRRDELERVFRRFGKCYVQVKDKYGFAVYDFPADAEKALRALRGKNICGRPITLSWSNRQPRPFPRHVRGGRTHESRGRNSAREDNVNQKLDSSGRPDYRMSDPDGRRFNSVDDLGDEATSYQKEDNNPKVEENDQNFRDGPPEERSFEPNILDSEGGKEQVHLSNDNGLEFERYQPSQADDRRDLEDDYQHITCSGGSAASEKDQEKKETRKTGDAALSFPEKAKSKQTCYICGDLGHKMRICPRRGTSNMRKLSRIKHKREDEFSYRNRSGDELRRLRSKSRGRLLSGRDAVPMRIWKSDRRQSSYRKHRTLVRSKHSPLAKETHRSRREESREGKLRQRDQGSPERHQAKKARMAESSPVHSDYTATRSRSHSKSASGFSSKSKMQLEHPKSASLSSSPTSDSTANCFSFDNSKINSKSRSSSPMSLALPVSSVQTLPSSPKKVQINQETSLMNSASPESKGGFTEMEPLEGGDAGSCDIDFDITRVAMENQSAKPAFKVDEDDHMDKALSDRKDDYLAMTRDEHEVENSRALGLEQDHLTSGCLSRHDLNDSRELAHTGVCITTDDMLIPIKSLHSEVSRRSHALTSITPEEMHMALKHYNMEQLVEHTEGMPVEAFFGSARLWPWEIIYFRRLRKGLVSVENYERRVSQNREFSIVDKYIRSSSGWGDLNQDCT